MAKKKLSKRQRWQLLREIREQWLKHPASLVRTHALARWNQELRRLVLRGDDKL